jgi:Holliday junction resolvasome RuvABC endonuclease subunit
MSNEASCKILSLDVSTKTGWSVITSNGEDFTRDEYGKIDKSSEPEGQYPGNYVSWAYDNWVALATLITDKKPDVLVIEETSSGSKSIYSQKILEWIHFLLAQTIKESNIKAIYLLTEQWRRETGCLMSKDEKKRNKAVRTFKKDHGTKIAYNEDGKRIGIIGRKHVNVRRANEVFSKFLKEPLRMKDEDTADSLLLGYCYHLRRKVNG